LRCVGSGGVFDLRSKITKMYWNGIYGVIAVSAVC